MSTRKATSRKPARRKARPAEALPTAAGWPRVLEFLSSTAFRIVAVALLWIVLQPFFSVMLFFTGDEPHYLLSALSLVRDGDFNLVNNYREHQAREFGGEFATKDLTPQWYPHLNFSVIPAEHGTVFPMVVAPMYALGGVMGVRWFLIVLSGLTCLLVGAATDLIVGVRWAGTLATLLLATTPVWQMSASRVYPDALVGFLVSVAVWLLVRGLTGRPSALQSFTAAFCLGLLPLLAIKYVAIAAPIALATIALERKNRALIAGYLAALAAGVVNMIIFHDQGALGGNFLATQPHLFGAPEFRRYWKQWFDSHHGLFAYQPYTILVLWAGVYALRRIRPQALIRQEQPRETVLAGLALAMFGFTLIHAFWLSNPGWSAPGRYLAALVPIICILVAAWATQNDRFRPLRLTILCLSAAMSLVVLLEALRRNVQPDFILRGWVNLFPTYWGSWHTHPRPVSAEPGVGPYLLVIFIVVTKMMASRRAPAVVK
jgi:hypothetical protein